jgi:hypothetical protein
MTTDVRPDTTAPGEELPGAAEAARLRRSYGRRHVFTRIGLHAGGVLAAFLCAAPFLWSLAAFWRAVVPLTFPGIVAVVVFAFTLTASEFIYALAFVSPTTEKVISTGVPTELVRGDVFFWQSLQAATVLVAIPMAIVFNSFLDRFIAGFTQGAVKD